MATGAEYNYDPLGRLTKITFNAGNTVSYSYDSMGNRTATVSGSGPCCNQFNIIDKSGDFTASVQGAYYRISANAIVTLPPSPADGSVYKFKVTGGTSTFVFNGGGRVNSSGVNTAKFAYSPFGETSSISGSSFGYTGQLYDSEVGLYNYKMRYYSPAIGRFMQPDPLNYAAGDLNLYSYVGNDAVNLVDPLGLCGCELVSPKPKEIQYATWYGNELTSPDTFIINTTPTNMESKEISPPRPPVIPPGLIADPIVNTLNKLLGGNYTPGTPPIGAPPVTPAPYTLPEEAPEAPSMDKTGSFNTQTTGIP